MSNFLDKNGLLYFYQQLKTKFYNKTEVDNLIANKTIYASHDGEGTVTIHGMTIVPDASTEEY